MSLFVVVVVAGCLLLVDVGVVRCCLLCEVLVFDVAVAVGFVC